MIIDGKVYLDFKIDIITATEVLYKEMFTLENPQYFNITEYLNSLKIIRSKYSKVFGKDGNEVLLPVSGYYDTAAQSFCVNSDEVLNGLFHVFNRYDNHYIFADQRGICKNNHEFRRPTEVLYKGQDASDVFNAMKYVEMFYEELLKNNKSVKRIKK